MFIPLPPTVGTIDLGNEFQKLTITSAFTTVLTSGYTPTYGQLSGINPEYLVFLHGTASAATASVVGFMDSDGTLLNTLNYTSTSESAVARMRAHAADNTSNYFIAGPINNNLFILSTSLDGTTVNWGRKLNYGTLEEEVGIAVTNDYVGFFVTVSTNTIVGVINKADGSLVVDKQFGGGFRIVAIQADQTALYLVDTTGVVFAIGWDGSKLWQKSTSAAINGDGVNGFCVSSNAAFISGIDQTDTTTLTVLKLSLSDGSLLGQVNIDPSTSTVLTSLDSSRMPQNLMGYGGGKIVTGFVIPATPYDFHAIILDESLSVETNLLRLSTNSGSDDTIPTNIVVDNSGNWFVTGYREPGPDHFISGVLEDGTFTPAASDGWSTTSRSVSTPTYTISNGSTALSDVAPSTNASETITVSSPSDLSTEAW